MPHAMNAECVVPSPGAAALPAPLQLARAGAGEVINSSKSRIRRA